MTILKCRMCGGNIRIVGGTHGVCDSCGGEISLPKKTDNERVEMYNRANHFRMLGNYQKAESAYEHLIAMDREDAEAHWCLMLCRYGVEYVLDVENGEYIPTCCKVNNKPIYDDIDYLAAVDNADYYNKELYRAEADKIEYIREKSMDALNRGGPCDVFICCNNKFSAQKTSRAHASAQGIYNRLQCEGVHAFFSRVEPKPSSDEYEPLVFAALQSAKIMLVIADESGNINSPWVKSEWKRYLSMCDEDPGKLFIPVCVDVSPKELPAEIPRGIQAIELNNPGAIETLTENILSHLGKNQTGKALGTIGSNIDLLMMRADQYLEDGKKEDALALLESYVHEYMNEEKIHIKMLLLKYDLKSLDDIFKKTVDENALVNDMSFKMLAEYGGNAVRNILLEYLKKYESKIRCQLEYTEKAQAKKNYIEICKNSTKYLREEIASTYPKEYKEYTDLYAEYSKEAGTKGICCLKMPVIAMITVFLSGLYYSIILGSVLFGRDLMNLDLPDNMTLPLTIIYLLSPFIFCGGLVASLAWMSNEYADITEMYNESFFGIILQIVVSAFVAGVPGLILAFIYIIQPLRSVVAIIVFLLMLIHTLICLFNIISSTIRGKRWRAAAKKCAGYQKKVIAPLSAKVKEKLQTEYSDLIGTEEKKPWDTWKMTLDIEKAN